MIHIAKICFVFIVFCTFTTPTFALVINEVYPAPPNNGVEWVEVYNDADTQVSLDDYSLTDDHNHSITWSTHTIGPKSYASATSNSVLNNSTDTVSLKKGSDVIDSISYSSISSSQSYGRCNDGGSWQIISSPSQNASNNTSCAVVPTTNPTSSPTTTPQAPSYDGISITEGMVYPDGTNEWVELYNSNESAVTLSNWYIDDVTDGGSSPQSFSVTIGSKSYAIVDAANSMFNNTGDTITLLDASRTIKSHLIYSTSEKGKSVGLSAGKVCVLAPSKGSENGSCIEKEDQNMSSPKDKVLSPTSSSPPSKSSTSSTMSKVTIDPSITIQLQASGEADTSTSGAVLAAEDEKPVATSSSTLSPIRFIYAGTALASLITFVVLLGTILKKK